VWILQVVALALAALASVLVFRELLAALAEPTRRRGTRSSKAREPRTRVAAPLRRAA
jgi:membrane protein implicated in regulation of membrane protease activity